MKDWKDNLAALTGYVKPVEDDSSADDAAGMVDLLAKRRQRLRVSMERAGRAGKTVTLVKGFSGSDAEIDALCRLLKQKCGVGGSAKEGEIIIQGDHRQRIVELLKNEGYSQTR